MTEKLDVLGAKIDKVVLSEAMDIIKEYFEGSPCKMIVTPNPEIIMAAVKDPELMDIINNADLVVPDGIGLVYASKIMRQPFKERVTGIDLLEAVLSQLNHSGGSVYLLGSKPGISERAAEKMTGQYPKLQIAGTYHGYFSKEEEEEIIHRINSVSPDFLCVALGSPKQERFIYKYKDMLKAKVVIGVGGSLDVWAGELKRAPVFYRKYGLEWLYRLIQQPSRYKRMAALPVFMMKIIFRGKM